MTQGGAGSLATEGAPAGFDIKKGGLGSAAQALALATLCGVLFLTFLDNTVVSVGLANVQSDLHAGVTSLQWVVNGYALDLRQLHAGRRHARRHLRPQARHARRGGHLLWRLGRGRAGGECRLAHRRPRDHGDRRRRQRARHPVHHQARVPRPGDPRRRARRVGRGVGTCAWPSGPSSAASSSASPAGGPSSGSTWASASSRSFWRPSPSPRRRTARGAVSMCLGFIFGAAFLACISFAVIQGEESGLHRTVDRDALRPVRPLRHCVRHHGEEGQEPDARPVDVPTPSVRRLQFRRVRRRTSAPSPSSSSRRCISRSWPTRRPTRRRWTSSRWRPG